MAADAGTEIILVINRIFQQINNIERYSYLHSYGYFFKREDLK
jgi:hypothetical protein